MQEILTVKDLSKVLNTPERTIRHWATNKTLPSYKIGEKLFFNRREIMNLVGGEIKEKNEDPVADWLYQQLEQRRMDQKNTAGNILQDIPHQSAI